MSLNVKLEAFEGPFDLLFHLIEKNEIDIYDIPISDLTDQYLSYLKNMDRKQLDIASEFLVMAATLVKIKSQMLLPIHQDNEEQVKLELAANNEELDPRTELVRRLVEYKKYKIVARILQKKEEEENKLFKRPPQDFSHLNAEKDFSLSGLTLKNLKSIYHDLINKKRTKPKMHIVKKNPIPLTLKIKEVYHIVENNDKKILFSDLTTKISTLGEFIVTFLAVLELIKLSKIIADQNILFGEIIIFQRKDLNAKT